MLRRYYVITNSKTNEYITTMLRQDFKREFYKDVVLKLKSKEYKIKVY